ncbi:hypothetical protein PYL12_11220, partial [Staphylococcus epidermidis]|nr:hypothetical protein [Staphylococcus epidermidis]MDH9053876.1 hypothetical protein [Staphylococcus epidermidis]MDH9542280.1 hypothetical protein [Staphylococcus epidermidis]MDH9555937.1 hypothetical protein [Staphylococcus epidermidis]MDH9558193.1 hypothetical protein [Staphylococcus epidermidis]
LGFVLMALNIRKVVAQRAENNQKIYKKDNFYIISIEIVFFSLIQELYVPDSFIVLELLIIIDYVNYCQILVE